MEESCVFNLQASEFVGTHMIISVHAETHVHHT